MSGKNLVRSGRGATKNAKDSVRPSRERRRARMSDVATLAGVSAMTVSRALRSPGLVMPETLRRITAAVSKTGYLPDRIAGSLSSQRSTVVGMVVPSLRNSLFAETIKGVHDGLEQEYDLMISDSGYTLKGEEEAVVAFLSQRVCGIVLHNTKHTPRTLRLLRESGVPCVETGNLNRHPLDMSVGYSNFAAAQAMTEYLINTGYRRIGFACLPLRENDRACLRRAGHIAALRKHGLPVIPDLLLEARPGLRSGGEALVKLMESGHDIDAAFLTGDVLGTGALLEANRRGWKVPEQIAIAGSDDNELHEHVQPSLTSLRFPRYEIGEHAAGMLLDRFEGKSTGAATMNLGFEIMERDST